MISKQKIVDQIKNDWSTKIQSEICIAILNYLFHDKSKNISHITYASLRKITGDIYDNEDLMTAIQYLSGDRVKLLDVKFELIENEQFFDISNIELKEARKTGELVHPETAELIKDYQEKVYVYFQPSSLVKNLQR